jgi:hypothetical protein
MLWRCGALVADYLRAPDAEHPQNAWLFVCDDSDYSLDKLDAAARRAVRRAERDLRFEFLDPAEFLEFGAVPYCDTRRRAGLSDGTPEGFRKYATFLMQNPGNKILGAWRGDSLAAYLWMLLVDDYAAITPFSADAHLGLRPNDGLIHFALDYCLVRRKLSIVTFGLSSIQEDERSAGLVAFKKKVGFAARPVHRAFAFHPLIKPLLNSLTLRTVRGMLKCFPRSRPLRKAAGVLTASLGLPSPAADLGQNGRDPS